MEEESDGFGGCFVWSKLESVEWREEILQKWKFVVSLVVN